MTLTSALLSAQGDPVAFRSGSVVTTSPLVVNFGNGPVRVDSRLGSYTPAVGNVVLVLVTSTSMVVLGTLVAS